MSYLKQHGTAAGTAAIVAAGILAAIPQVKEKTIEKPVHVTVQASKHAWQDLSDDEKADLAGRIKGLGVKVSIFCDGGDCRDLQTDLDDAFEDAGVASERAIPVNPLGYGFAVLYGVGQYPAGSQLVAALKASTNGRLVPELKSGLDINGLVVAIGKRPRK